MCEKYIDNQQNIETLKKAGVHLENIYASIGEGDERNAFLHINAEFFCHALELLQAYAATYEDAPVYGLEYDIGVCQEPTH